MVDLVMVFYRGNKKQAKKDRLLIKEICTHILSCQHSCSTTRQPTVYVAMRLPFCHLAILLRDDPVYCAFKLSNMSTHQDILYNPHP